jgi:hypothetical protein
VGSLVSSSNSHSRECRPGLNLSAIVVNLESGNIRNGSAMEKHLSQGDAHRPILLMEYHKHDQSSAPPMCLSQTHAFPLSQYPSALTPSSRLPSTQHHTLPNPKVFDRRLYILITPSRVSISNLNVDPVVFENRYVFSGRSG